ncbi:hypothetical protein PV726_24520 [Streptomyces europaeiscabiei]|uniref:hypothetical protein n=1 Tax=Streptomyces europaeiscabiei TaxID=146819 RepID=UPI0029B4EDEC|nr:hypothetical protein [Streptomyces europaeiscabiei]MDX3693454.1 hypothetical protein [Streptomyces europaeiscabiei]
MASLGSLLMAGPAYADNQECGELSNGQLCVEMANLRGKVYSSYRKDSGAASMIMLGYQPKGAAKVYDGDWQVISKGQVRGSRASVSISLAKCIRAIMKTPDENEYISKWRCP